MTNSPEGVVSVDELDHALIAVMRRSARATLAEIGNRIGLSAPAVKRRLDRLEEMGVIEGYTARVNERMLGSQVEAFAELTFAGDTPVRDISRVAAGIDQVVTVFTTAGDPDALVHLRVNDVDHLEHAIDQLRRSGLVTSTKTLIVLRSWSPV
jgi:Lrp/AsnC family transcriptional regulator, leucine-responsive regulatory protein